jgi:hypothetical protein
MRTYPTNSPEAAGRLLGLGLIADGHVCASEIGTLQRLQAEQRLGLQPGALGELLRDLCEDLLMANPQGALVQSVDDELLRALMAEVTDPRLRSEVLTLAQAAAQADEHLAEGEALVLEAARRHWQLAPHREPVAA